MRRPRPQFRTVCAVAPSSENSAAHPIHLERVRRNSIRGGDRRFDQCLGIEGRSQFAQSWLVERGFTTGFFFPDGAAAAVTLIPATHATPQAGRSRPGLAGGRRKVGSDGRQSRLCSNGSEHAAAREVKTKFSKSFPTFFFPVGEDIRQMVADWVGYLTREKLFGFDDPFFPPHILKSGGWPVQVRRTSPKALVECRTHPGGVPDGIPAGGSALFQPPLVSQHPGSAWAENLRQH